MVESSTKNDTRLNLYELFGKVENKTKLAKKLAENFHIEYDSVRKNWMYGKNVPEEKYNEALAITQRYRALEIELSK